MIHAGRKKRPNGPGSWVEGLLSVSFFWYSFCFLFFSSSPICASLAWVGVEGFALCSDLFFLRSFLLVSFLGVVARRPRGGGMKYLSNK